MPYITQDRKDLINSALVSPQNSGELNYVFTINALEYLGVKGINYQTYNDIIGALEGAKLEIYRRLVVPYENQKCLSNGDVYGKIEKS